MKGANRRGIVVYAMPMVLALVAARHAVRHVRTVDFLLVFAAGALFGVTLLGVLRAWLGGEDRRA